jgi:lipopolysaccharide/colanic/teichoic acid biosynthesis glycosyltransferase
VSQHAYPPKSSMRPRPGPPIFDPICQPDLEVLRVESLNRGIASTKSEELDGQSAALRATPSERHLLRRAFDVVCAGAGLALLSPVLAGIALSIKLDDGGSVFYSHVRVGQGFNKFRFFKFRTMISSAVAGSPVTAPDDARVTRVGRILRKYKLDELPQLVNVLKGEMQLVGARPQLEWHVNLFREEFEELLQSRPGITDLATLSFRNEERFFQTGSIEEQYIKKIMPLKLQMALEYSRTRTFFSDLDIILRTALGLQPPSAKGGDARVASAMSALPNLASRKSS